MSADLVNKNNVLDINKVNIGIHITDHGSDWLWTVFACTALSLLIHLFLVLYYERRENWFKHYLHMGPLMSTTAIAYAYFSLASNLGWAGVPVEFHHITIGDQIRQVFYARFIGWFCGFPSLLFLFELNAESQNIIVNLKLSDIIQNVLVPAFAYEIWIVSLLIGSVIRSSYKWGYWTFGAVAIFFALYRILNKQLFGTDAVKSFLGKVAIAFLTITTILYPVSWALSEGGNVIQPDSEAVFYGVLDMINFVFIPFVLIYDATKNGTVTNGAGAAQATEKAVNPNAEARVSGETA